MSKLRLFHITRVENVDSILTQGILPGYKKGLTMRGDIWDKVFLTNNVDKIIKTQGGKAWEKNIAIFEVEVDVSDCHPYIYGCFDSLVNDNRKISDFEFNIDKVLPEQIKSFTTR